MFWHMHNNVWDSGYDSDDGKVYYDIIGDQGNTGGGGSIDFRSKDAGRVFTRVR